MHIPTKSTEVAYGFTTNIPGEGFDPSHIQAVLVAGLRLLARENAKKLRTLKLEVHDEAVLELNLETARALLRGFRCDSATGGIEVLSESGIRAMDEVDRREMEAEGHVFTG
jgi:hypothetical protein